MDDENMTAIYNSHIMKELKNTHFKCQTTNKYIHRSFVNDHNCDCKPNEYYECDDEDVNGFNPYTNISFQTICDGFQELLPKRINEQNHTDETECQQWSCDNIYTHCDGIWHCLNGADEINCNLFPSLKCPNNHHRCVSPHTNQFMCLSIEKMNDGKVDCLGGSDEIKLCRPEYASLHSQIFYCKRENMIPCLPSRLLCNGKEDCDDGDDEQFCKTNRTLTTGEGICTSSSSILQSDVENFLCNQTASYIKQRTIDFKLDGMSNSIVYQMKNIENTLLSSSSNIQISSNQYQSYCQRGLHLHVWLNNRSIDHACLCPPSYYGERCQYQNQRISLTIKFRAFSDSYQTLFAIIISLIDDGDQRIIHSYEQITYLSFSHCETKFNIYLLYATRPKNLTKQYRIHIDFYEKISLTYRGSVLLPVTFPFLPLQRLTFIVNIPRIDDKTSNSVKFRCVHGKSIQYSNNPDISNFCQCNQGWSGRYCTIKYNCNCANDSVCLGISASNRSICICPIHKFGPRCFLTNTICQNNPICQNGGQCIPNDEYFASKKQFICLCQKGFTGDLCEINETKLILSFHKNIALSQSIFIHFIQITDQRFPVRSTTLRTISFPQDSLTIYWSRPFHLVFIEFENKNYYLTIKQTIYSESTIINKRIDPSDHCPHIREVLNETIVQWDLIRRIKYYHLPCRNQSLNLSCFYDDIHLCLCYDFQQQRLANCFNFTHNMTFDCAGQSVCKNNGICFQDVLECPTRSICMCQPCFYGVRCQFSTSGFGLSLDAILGYHILPNGTLNDQPIIIKISFALTIICMVIGLLDSIFSVMTFKNKVVREVGCGLYLLCSSITTLLIMIIFGLKFFILLFAQMTIISNRSFLSMQCHSIDFLLRIGLYMDQWLNACVAAERACTVIKGTNFSKKKSKRTAIFVIILLVIIISGTCIHDPIYRDLIDEESNNDNVKRTWCIVNYGSALRAYNSVINTIHFFGPFLINLISSLILITKKSRQEATIHRKRPYKQILIEQFQRNKHLLTAPIVSVILTLPRLIITFVSKCLKSNDDAWLFLTGYFISFIPSMLTFIIFILPSNFYQKEFRKSCTRIQMMIQRRSHLTS
jgi:hypothetical protein